MLVKNPVTGKLVANEPKRGGSYRSEYCDLILKLFEDMLAASGEKLADKILEEDRSLSEQAAQAESSGAEIGADGKKKRRPRAGLRIVERRTVKRREWRLVCAELPSLAKFGRLVGVSSATITNWRHSYPSFDDACTRCTDMLGDALFQRGLRGQYDPEMVKFVGKNWAGMKDRHEVTGADGAPLNPPQELRGVPTSVLDATYAELMDLKRRLLEAGQKQQGEESK